MISTFKSIRLSENLWLHTSKKKAFPLALSQFEMFMNPYEESTLSSWQGQIIKMYFLSLFYSNFILKKFNLMEMLRQSGRIGVYTQLFMQKLDGTETDR